MMVDFGTVVIAHSSDDDAALDEVKSMIKDRGFTFEDVRIRRKDGGIVVEAKRNLNVQ